MNSLARLLLWLVTVLGSAAVFTGCIETTIRKPAVPTPVPTPPLRVEANIKLEDFQKLCNFVPEEGDQRTESGSDESGKSVQITLGTGKRRTGSTSAVKAGCTPGKTFTFSGPELRLQLN